MPLIENPQEIAFTNPESALFNPKIHPDYYSDTINENDVEGYEEYVSDLERAILQRFSYEKGLAKKTRQGDLDSGLVLCISDDFLDHSLNNL